MILHGFPRQINLLQITGTLEHLRNCRLLTEHMPISLLADVCKLAPSIKVLLVALVTMRFLRIFPVT